MRTTLFLLFTLTALSFAQAENQVRLAGDVVEEFDMYGENLLPGVKVYPREHTLSPEKWMTTDENGKFSLVVDRNDEQLPGEAVLYARTADNSQIGAINCLSWDSLSDDEKLNYCRIPLSPASFVTGTVVDADGKPVAGAMVEHNGYESYFTKTDEKGNFKILLPDRGGILFASHEDFGVDFVGIQASSENSLMNWALPHREPVRQRKPVQLTLQSAETVKIRVVTDTGVPLPGILVGPVTTTLTKETEKRHKIGSSLGHPVVDAFWPGTKSEDDEEGLTKVTVEEISFTYGEDGQVTFFDPDPEDVVQWVIAKENEKNDTEDGKTRVIFSYPKAGEVRQFPQSWNGMTDADGIATLGQIPESMLENMRFSVCAPWPHKDGIPMPDGTRYFVIPEAPAWAEMDASDDVRTCKVSRGGRLNVTLKLPDGTPAPGMWIMFENVPDPFAPGTDEDGKTWTVGKLSQRVNMYLGSDLTKPLLSDIDLGDGTQVKEIDCVYDGILLHGTISPPDDGVSKERLAPRSFDCGDVSFYEKDGKYRCVIPRTAGKHTISLEEGVWSPRDEEFRETIDVKGDETEIRFDIRLKKKSEPQS